MNSSTPASFRTTYFLRASLERCWSYWTQPERLAEWLSLPSGSSCQPEAALPFAFTHRPLDEGREHPQLDLEWLVGAQANDLLVHFGATPNGVALTLERRAELPPPPGTYYGFAPEHLSFQSQTWDFLISQLRSVLEDGAAAVQISTGDLDREVALTTEIAAPSQQAFSALTKIPQLRQWEEMCMEGGHIESHLGGRYSFGWASEHEHGDGPNQIVTYAEGAHLAYSWFGEVPATVSWELTTSGNGKTRVAFRHAKFELDPSAVWEYRLGWSRSLFALKWYLERGEQQIAWIQRLG